LHIRIDKEPKYYSFEEYKGVPNESEKNAPRPVSSTPANEKNSNFSLDNSSNPSRQENIKEKILRNLDKICLDPVGELANYEEIKKN